MKKAQLRNPAMREVFWVTRAKDNLRCRVMRKFQHGRRGNILRDDLIRLTGPARKHSPVELRRVLARVEVDGQLREMTFLTNHLEWSAQTIANLYRCRWEIESDRSNCGVARLRGKEATGHPAAAFDHAADRSR